MPRKKTKPNRKQRGGVEFDSRDCIADIESRALLGTVKLPMEDEEDVKSQTMIEAVEDAPPAY
ncbi:uncharacterized protein ARMOST_20639 [Armillaria ostoyae]|uniref:Uncharacterized protein n=1 Tax=Armillaria ostoyae TaxID=47428 RepID=A0A284S7V0_ARMOS|nr:uncharacterized protein ARMOST_20639 [Armillaria ostoyae]